MASQMALYILPFLIPPTISIIIALVAWQRRSVPGAQSLAWLMVAAAVWALAYVLELHSTGLPGKLFWNDVEYLGVSALPLAWVVFALDYTGRGRWLTKRNLALLSAVPALTVVMVWTNGSHSLFFSSISLLPGSPFATLQLTFGLFFWIMLAYAYLMVLAGTLMILQVFLSAAPWYRGQAGVILVSCLVPWIASVLYLRGVTRIDLTPFLISLAGLAILWGIVRMSLLDLTPVARGAVVQAMDDSMVMLDAQHRIVDLNLAAEQILGCPARQAIGKAAAELVPHWPELAAWGEKAAEGHLEVSLIGKAGQAPRSYDVQFSRLYGPQAKVACCLLVWRDITDRRQMEEALRQSNVQLKARNEELDAFAHTVAHDLKDSLAFMVSAADLLLTERTKMTDKEMEGWLKSMQGKGMKMCRVTDSLLLLATVRKSQIPIGPVDMADIVAEACQRLAPTIEAYQAEMVMPSSWPAAVGYGPWLEEVWLNLIDNAIKHGGRPPRVELGCSLPGPGKAGLGFWVHDNGPGLTAEEQARLFEPLAELPRVRGLGYGLGLSIVRRIVEKLGGQVTVECESTPGQGAVFRFTLPEADGENDSTLKASQAPQN
jgi:PAS domain S-box-containing protein